MTFQKFVAKIEKLYADQGTNPESERLRYGQIIMNELWDVWPRKYHEIMGSDKDPFYCDILDKNPYDLLVELQSQWPFLPPYQKQKDEKNYSTPSPEQIRIQRLEKKIKKLQASNKKHKKDLNYYKRIVRDFPWVESTGSIKLENISLKNELHLKTWAIKGLTGDLKYLDNSITDGMLTAFDQLAIHIGGSFTEIDGENVTGKNLITTISSVIKNIKQGMNLYQIREKDNES